jgi:hypothetical protein
MEKFQTSKAHWNNSSSVEVSFDFVTLYWFWVDQSLLLLINASCGEAANTNFTVFGLTWHGLKPTIYRTQD